MNQTKVTTFASRSQDAHWEEGLRPYFVYRDLGVREATAGKVLGGKYPDRVVEQPVQRVIPNGAPGRQVLPKSTVHPGAEHPHEAPPPHPLAHPPSCP